MWCLPPVTSSRQQKANTASCLKEVKGVIGALLKWEEGEKCKRKKICGKTSQLKILSMKTQDWCLGLDVF